VQDVGKILNFMCKILCSGAFSAQKQAPKGYKIVPAKMTVISCYDEACSAVDSGASDSLSVDFDCVPSHYK